jgi:hypothetical protein
MSAQPQDSLHKLAIMEKKIDIKLRASTHPPCLKSKQDLVEKFYAINNAQEVILIDQGICR